jgi:hypothetical protein
MQSPKTWRQLLGTIISDPQEEQRLIDIMGIRPITLVRWVQNKSEPRPYFLRQLLDALPQHRDSLLPLLEKEFPGFSELVEDELPKEIASSFYTHVLDTYVATTPSMRFWSICPLILQHILEHLDHDQLGMELLMVRCMPPSGHDKKIHSLREYVALGTPPWQTDLEEKNLFLGAESLAGYAVSSCHTAVIQNMRQDRSFLPAQKEENERSAAAFPMMLASRIAGCLLVSSTQPHYFHRPRLTILKHYTNLLVLAFQTEDFYDPATIELNMMPGQHIQQSYFATFRQRVADVLAQAKARQQSLTSQQAEQLARQHLEEELLQIPL